MPDNKCLRHNLHCGSSSGDSKSFQIDGDGTTKMTAFLYSGRQWQTEAKFSEIRLDIWSFHSLCLGQYERMRSSFLKKRGVTYGLSFRHYWLC